MVSQAKLLLSILTMTLTFSSCSSLLKSQPERDFELLSGEEKIGKRTKKQVEGELTVYESLAMNTFKVNLFPIIPEYLEKFKEVDELLKDVPNPEEKTCFVVDVQSDSYNPKASQFETWKAEALDHQDDFIHMEWVESSLQKEPKTTTIPSYHGPRKRFHNRGVLCAVDTIETARYFQVKLSPEVVQWPLKGDMKFDWRVPYKTIENGEVVIKRKKKKIQRYKGW